MFKIPNWEDSPDNNLSFKNVSAKNKSQIKKKSPSERQKQIVQEKPRFKAKIKANSKLSSVKALLLDINEKPKIKQTNTQKQEKYSLKSKKEHSKDHLRDSDNNIEINQYNTDKLDKMILDVKKQTIDTYKSDDKSNLNNTNVKFKHQDSLPKEETNKAIFPITNTTEDANGGHLEEKIVNFKQCRKKEMIKSLFQSQNHRTQVNVNNRGSKLRDRMLDRLKAAKFRYLNEKLYTSSGSEAQKLFQTDPAAFQTYHDGYQQQVKKWPVKPLDVIVKRIQKMPKSHLIADMGCGEAELSKRVSQSVRSFDLLSVAPGVEICDMAHTPLLAASMDVAVYCLALMGTNLTQYLVEANRVLKVGGCLLIAEVESRFGDVDAFTRDVQRLGFSLKKLDKSQKVFFFLEFTKERQPSVKKAKLPTLSLKPCIYKKR